MPIYNSAYLNSAQLVHGSTWNKLLTVSGVSSTGANPGFHKGGGVGG